MPSFLTYRIRSVNPSRADFCNNAQAIEPITKYARRIYNLRKREADVQEVEKLLDVVTEIGAVPAPISSESSRTRRLRGKIATAFEATKRAAERDFALGMQSVEEHGEFLLKQLHRLPMRIWENAGFHAQQQVGGAIFGVRRKLQLLSQAAKSVSDKFEKTEHQKNEPAKPRPTRRDQELE